MSRTIHDKSIVSFVRTLTNRVASDPSAASEGVLKASSDTPEQLAGHLGRPRSPPSLPVHSSQQASGQPIESFGLGATGVLRGRLCRLVVRAIAPQHPQDAGELFSQARPRGPCCKSSPCWSRSRPTFSRLKLAPTQGRTGSQRFACQAFPTASMHPRRPVRQHAAAPPVRPHVL